MSGTAVPPPPPGSDPANWSADELCAVIHLYLSEDHRDLRMVVAAMHLLAVKDPHRAQLILDMFELAQAMTE